MASIASLTPEQQKDFRLAEDTFHGFNPNEGQQVYDALGALEILVLIGNADNVDAPAKDRIKKLREAIKKKVAQRR